MDRSSLRDSSFHGLHPVNNNNNNNIKSLISTALYGCDFRGAGGIPLPPMLVSAFKFNGLGLYAGIPDNT